MGKYSYGWLGGPNFYESFCNAINGYYEDKKKSKKNILQIKTVKNGTCFINLDLVENVSTNGDQVIFNFRSTAYDTYTCNPGNTTGILVSMQEFNRIIQYLEGYWVAS